MPLPFSNFNAILGVDGLSRYGANVDYFEKRVVFEKVNGKKIHFVRENRKPPTKIISSMTARKYLMKGIMLI